MKPAGIIGIAVLSLILGVAAPVYAQQEEQKRPEEDKARPAQQEEKKAQPEKSAPKHEEKAAQKQEKNSKQEAGTTQQKKSAQQEGKPAPEKHAQQAKPQEQAHRATGKGGRIPDARFKANFGREHTFRVSQSEYSGGRRFQYGGYWFGFVDSWPSNWLYTQDVFVVEINGVYYLCNPMFPGVNVALDVTL